MSGREVSSNLGFFGNVWIRQNILSRKGDVSNGHKHKFDHVSLLTQGSVTVEIEGYPPKEFVAPTFIVIRKEHNHKMTALADGTTWFCIFALRDLDGEPIGELYDSNIHDPMFTSLDLQHAVADDYWDKAMQLESKTTEEIK
jgi:hypothetical protein